MLLAARAPRMMSKPPAPAVSRRQSGLGMMVSQHNARIPRNTQSGRRGGSAFGLRAWSSAAPRLPPMLNQQFSCRWSTQESRGLCRKQTKQQHGALCRSPLSIIKRPLCRLPSTVTSSSSTCGRLDTMTSGSHCSGSGGGRCRARRLRGRTPALQPSLISSLPSPLPMSLLLCLPGAKLLSASLLLACWLAGPAATPGADSALVSIAAAAAAAAAGPTVLPLLALLQPPVLLDAATSAALSRAFGSSSAGCCNRTVNGKAPIRSLLADAAAATAAAGESTPATALGGSVGRRGCGGMCTTARRSTSYLQAHRMTGSLSPEQGEACQARQPAVASRSGFYRPRQAGQHSPPPTHPWCPIRVTGKGTTHPEPLFPLPSAPHDANDLPAIGHAADNAGAGQLHEEGPLHQQWAQLEGVGPPAEKRVTRARRAGALGRPSSSGRASGRSTGQPTGPHACRRVRCRQQGRGWACKRGRPT